MFRYVIWQGQEYAEAYMLEYQRIESATWIRFHDRKGGEVSEQMHQTWALSTLCEVTTAVIDMQSCIIAFDNDMVHSTNKN